MKIITDDNQEISFDSIRTIELNENEKLIIQIPHAHFLSKQGMENINRMQHILDLQFQSKSKVIVTSDAYALAKVKKIDEKV
jgi:hypothetical protein